jgi:AraC-like DNA-binding protein
MDPLTHTITLLRPRSLLWKQGDVGGDWTLRFPSTAGVSFSLIAGGDCVLHVEGRSPLPVGDGDFLLLLGPPRWALGVSTTPIDFDDEGPAQVGEPAATAGPTVTLLGGHFRLEGADPALLRTLGATIVRIASSQAGRLRRVLDLVRDEAQTPRPGGDWVMTRLLEIMLVEALREGSALQAGRGLLAGLSDPRIGAALGALHGDVGRSWTVADLARVAGMSRSVFAGRFALTVGRTPADYLARWRMALAREALKSGDRPLAEVASACGYGSVSAFSIAFRRLVGSPPSRWAANAAANAEGDQKDGHA